MILKRIEAKNVLKYRHLEITDIPASGQIAVAGPNESGKTAIGETICLGLFGRTYSLGPDELGTVIRWGDYGGVVGVTFSAGDGEEYSIVREIDNTGKHEARLYRLGEERPIADGVEAVDRAMRRVGGFTYSSFVDSFYLAQREIEVPHAKSATVKALIGVDRLEAVDAEVQAEVATIAMQIDALGATLAEHRGQIAELSLDRSQLGRLEATQESVAQQVAESQAKIAKLRTRAASIGKAASAVVNASKAFVQSTLHTTYDQWQERKRDVASSLLEAAKASKASGIDTHASSWVGATSVIKEFSSGLDEFDKVRNLASLYRDRLAYLLEDVPQRPQPEGPERLVAARADLRYTDRRAAARTLIDKALGRRKPVVVLAVFLSQLALIGWGGWLVCRIAPQSTLAGAIEAVLGLTEAARQSTLLAAGFGSLLLVGVAVALYVRLTRRLRDHRKTLDDIETEAQISRVEMGVIEAAEGAAVPDALQALRGVRNELVGSAVVAFEGGDGAVLVKREALAERLSEIRAGSDAAASGLYEAEGRFVRRADRLEEEMAGLAEQVASLDDEIVAERARWEQVESLERIVTGLDTKQSELRDQKAVGELGRALISGACRRIYERFNPELRRFVGKILPHLTENRYEHLEIDDDLKVRVFCNEKNDFVSLAEISNGTHRQLMLCVRLALSQALISSSCKTEQFIFFDEPFAFFDERRMANAIDVLRRISPQITQVWLAAQKFADPTAFDMMLDCSVDTVDFRVSGNGCVTASEAKSD